VHTVTPEVLAKHWRRNEGIAMNVSPPFHSQVGSLALANPGLSSCCPFGAQSERSPTMGFNHVAGMRLIDKQELRK
jgi:hypothetical protein